jgi:hypothetical protein
MTDFMLRTDTEAQMDDALESAGLLVEQDLGEGEITLMPVPGCYVDRIGPIQPSYDIHGQQIKAGDQRFHTNIRVTFELTEEQVSWLPTVNPPPPIPYRVFA